MKEAHPQMHWFVIVGGAIVLLLSAGCQPLSGSSDSLAQTLWPFVGDFARQALAAWLF